MQKVVAKCTYTSGTDVPKSDWCEVWLTQASNHAKKCLEITLRPDHYHSVIPCLLKEYVNVNERPEDMHDDRQS